MKHVQIVITNQAASPVMTGTPLLKPVPRNAAVLINIPALEQVIPAALEQVIPAVVVRPVAENIRLVLVLTDINGAEDCVLCLMLV